MNYDDTFEGFMLFRMQEERSSVVSNEWLTVSQSPEYEAFLLSEYDKQFN